jgi:hypothetical protein
MKEQIKKAVHTTEKGLARSLLRWKYNKEGKPIPTEGQLDAESALVTQRANEVFRRRGKTLWGEIKKAYRSDRDKGRRGGG